MKCRRASARTSQAAAWNILHREVAAGAASGLGTGVEHADNVCGLMCEQDGLAEHVVNLVEAHADA